MKTVFVLAFLVCWVNFSVSKDAALETVSKHGQLSVRGVNIVDENGEKVQLKGMSLFWDVWMPQYYNQESIDGIHEFCHSNVVRAAISVVTEYDGGYVETPEIALEHLYAVVDAAIEDDIYVIIDWHDHEADKHLNYSIEFFDIVSKKYAGVPNIIYETFNEPTSQSWNDVIKPYHEAVIEAIRANDPDNIIVLGTPTWSQSVDQAAANPIVGQKNIMYTLHFYAGTHKQWLRDTATNVLNNGLPIFVTEYGTVNADGDGDPDVAESRLWWDWLDEHNISYANWAVSDKLEGASVLVVNATSAEVCRDEFLTESGRLVVAQNMA
nr:glycoside hydrolase family 5 subfamily 2 [Agapanthia villosoviridescens]